MYSICLLCRSGACRKDGERFGVALNAWRDDGGLAGDVVNHEVGHLLGGVHTQTNGSQETEVGHLDVNSMNIDFWFNSAGSRCYGKSKYFIDLRMLYSVSLYSG